MSDITIKREEIPEKLERMARCFSAESGLLLVNAALHFRDLEHNLAEERETRIRFETMLGERAKEVGRLERTIAENEKALDRALEQRDGFEEALGRAYSIVAGQSPEWSNHFGISEAIDAIEARIVELEGAEPEAETVREWYVRWREKGTPGFKEATFTSVDDATALLTNPTTFNVLVEPRIVTRPKMCKCHFCRIERATEWSYTAAGEREHPICTYCADSARDALDEQDREAEKDPADGK